MPNVNTQFQGATLELPGAYYADSVSAEATTNPGLVPPLVLIGFGFGGQPYVPNTYTNPQDLLTALRGGPLAEFVQFLASPSPQLQGAGQVTYINASQNTQASLILQTGTGTPEINLTTVNYGAPGNLMQCAVAVGSNGLFGSRIITIYDGYANKGVVGDNIGVPFTLAYLGAATTVTYTVTRVNGLATSLVITSPNTGESLAIPLGAGQYATVAAVVEYINGSSYYTAIVQSDGTLPSTGLDSVSAIALPVPTSGVPNFVAVGGQTSDILWWFSQHAGAFVTAALNSGQSTSGSPRLALIPLTHFTGGTNVPPILSDYAACFNAALAIPGWSVVCDSNATGVLALGSQHAIQASSISGGRPRRFFSGSNVGDTLTSATVAADSLDAITSTYVYPGIYRNDPNTGLNTLYGGLYAAAAVAGMASGNPVATPLTNKALSANGVEVNLTQSQINTLQEQGVMPIALNSAGIASIISDLTTWQLDSNPENVFNQQVACRQYLNYLLVGTAQPYVGTIAYNGQMGIVRNAIVKALNAAIYAPGNNGVLVSWDPKSLTLKYTGTNQTLAITVNVVFVGQNRFITIYVPVQPLNLAA